MTTAIQDPSSTTDFKPESTENTVLLSDDAVSLAMLSATGWFTKWHKELNDAIESRADGWLRLAVVVSGGNVKSGNSNPSFDMKPT